jgi:hypothetical protein
VGDLEALQAVAALGLPTDNVKNLVDKFGTFGVMTLGPVVSGTRLAENEVVRTEELAERTGTNSVHGARFEIDEDSARNILVARSLVSTNRVSKLRTRTIGVK